MLNNIKFLLNSISIREFALIIISIIVLFVAKLYNDLAPSFIKYQNNKKSYISQSSLVDKYQGLLQQQKSKDDLLNQKKDVLHKGKAINSNDFNSSKYFDNFKDLYSWVCKKENQYLISKIIIKHTDIKGLIQLNIFGKTAKLKSKKCFIKDDIHLRDIFFTKKLTISSIVSNKVKINKLWYSKGDSVSKHIFIKDIKPDFVILKYLNEIKTVSLGDSL